MRGLVTCGLLGALVAANPVHGLTLYKCLLLDGSGVIYQDHEPDSSECRIETKEIDPDANVVPSDQSTNSQNRQPGTGSAATTPSGIPGNTEDDANLITGEEDEFRVNDPDNTPINEPEHGETGTQADSGKTSPTGIPAGGAGFGTTGGFGNTGVLGP